MIYTDKKHLTATTIKELTDFAEAIDLDWSDLVSDGSHVHYRLDDYTAELAIINGAKVVSTSEIIELAEKIVVI